MPDGNSPLNMGVPWSALSSVAGVDDAQAPTMSPELQKGLQGLSDLSTRFKVAGEAANVPSPPDEISMKKNPETGEEQVIVKTSKENYENTTRSAMSWHTALGGMQQELQRMDIELKQREMAARNQPPWVQLATALSANLASQKDMPGWVRGLGQTAAQLNPRPEQLQAQRREVLGQEAQLAEAGARIEETGLQHLQMQADKKSALEQKTKAEKDHLADRIVQTVRLNAKPGVPPTREEVEALAKVMDRDKVLGKEDMDNLVTMSGGMARQAAEGKTAEADRKVEVSKRIETLKTELGGERDVKKHALKLQELGVQYGLKKDLAVTNAEIRTAEAGQKEIIKQDASLAKIPPKEAGRLAAFDTTERYVDWFKEWVQGKQAEGVIGPLANYTVGQLPQFMKPAERVKFESMVTHETPRMLQMIGSGTAGGFSMLRFKGSLELLNKMGVNASLRLDQMDEIFGVLYDVNSQQRKGVMDSIPNAPWDKLSSLLGRDADYRPKGWSPLGGGGKSTTAPPAKKYPWEQ